jgi:glycosyltransferase involved in cell wall biosynthesis
MNKVSIALCTYNGAKFLPAQLESFLKQTRLPDELIACDDDSGDASAEILRKFAATAPFHVQIFVNEKRKGSTKNFEKAISLCTGEIIFLSDQDDIWAPEKIAETAAVFEKDKNIGMVFSDAEIVGENLQPTGRTLWSYTFPEEKRAAARKGSLFDILVSQNIVTGATLVFRSSFREKFTPIPDDVPNLIHDNWIALTIAATEARIEFLEKPLVKYRQHDSQQLGINFRELETPTFDARKKAYAATMEFLKEDIGRLQKLSAIFDCDPRFAEKRGTIDFAKLVAQKKEQIRHLQARANLPSSRTDRVFPVFREILSGRYQKFSKGFLSAGKDLLEK